MKNMVSGQMRLLVFMVISMQAFVSGCRNQEASTVIDKSVHSDSSVSVLFFHQTIRCKQCVYLENASFSIIRSNFPECLSTNKIQLKSVNVDEPGNDALAKQFGIESASLVIVEMKNGQPVRHKKIGKIYNLSSDQKKLGIYKS